MMEELIEKLLRVEGNRPDSIGVCTQWHRNPEGPEAVALIKATRAELAAMRDRERETLAVLQTAHESEAALIEQLAAAHATIHQLGENAAKAAGEYAEEVRQERLAVGAYLKHAADEAHGLAEKAQSDGAIAMFRAIGNSVAALGKTIENGAHEAYRAALTEPSDERV